MSIDIEDYLSVKEAALKYGVSERRVQKLCSENRIQGAKVISGVWLIPASSPKPRDERTAGSIPDMLSLSDLCSYLSISEATGRNWLKLKKIFATKQVADSFFFSKDDAENIKLSIVEGEKRLKSRRNKKYVEGCGLYKSYVGNDSPNLEVVSQVLDTVMKLSKEEDIEKLVLIVLADCAVKLLSYSRKITKEKVDLSFYLEHKELFGNLNELIDSLKYNPNLIYSYPELMSFDYSYVKGEDLLGLIYISSKNIGDRKQSGSYYTPDYIVSKLISSIEFSSNQIILDPCCGTGNFLLKLPSSVCTDNLRGCDIDEYSIKIARLNMAICYNSLCVETIVKNFYVKDFLLSEKPSLFSEEMYQEKPDVIIGNPPWGCAFSDDYKRTLSKHFNCMIGNYCESYSLFIEQSLNLLQLNGILSFVLPEAILSVGAHNQIRKQLCSKTSIDYVEYLGNVFDKVQCPSVIITLHSTKEGFTTYGTKVITGEDSFIIDCNRNYNETVLPFSINNSEYRILKSIFELKNIDFLKNKSCFALGIVTGDNGKYITTEKESDNEPILKGSDIYKYSKRDVNNFIYFHPESFQQVAPIEYYRAKEKLLYRFISDQLVFTYDDQQTLSLNSCNILIPRISGLNIKYVLAVLNSRIAQFVFNKKFHSVKVLRSHIEGIPIPIVSQEEQQTIMNRVDEIMQSIDAAHKMSCYDKIDRFIASCYKLSDSDYEIVAKSVSSKNNFLM